MSLPTDVDVLVIGAGPAGSTAAALAHRAGLSVAVVEKEVFPRFVIGESLLPRCMDLLGEAGMLPAVEARGYIVKRGALFLRGDERCCFDFSEAFTPGWTWTWQVPRADFDTTLATAAADMGIPVLFRHEVLSMTPPADGYDPSDRAQAGPVTVVRTPGGDEVTVRSRWVIDASGWGRVLPRLLGLDAPSGQQLRRAVFAHVEGDRRPADPAEAGRIWVCLHPEGAWIWIIPFSNGQTSVGVVAPEAFWAQHEHDDLTEVLRAGLAGDPNASARLADMKLVWPEARILRGYSSTVSRVHGPGYCLVGNATEFLDPVFSSGVTLALESANRATKAVIRAVGGEAIDWEAAYAEPMRHGVDVFRTYVNGWYDGTLPRIFFAAEPNEVFKSQICSVLAGYVWDLDNPFVRGHARRVSQVARLVAEAEGASA
jgi:flavin-dependent dehydrogenase